MTPSRRSLAAAVLVLWFGPAMSQTSSSTGGADAVDKGSTASPLPGGGTTKDLTMPGNGGVADTGLGGDTGGTGKGTVSGRPSRDTDAAGVTGTGLSVKGAAGQGIDGQGVSTGGIANGSASSTATGGSSGASAGK